MYHCELCGQLMRNAIHAIFHKLLEHYPGVALGLTALGVVIAARRNKSQDWSY